MDGRRPSHLAGGSAPLVGSDPARRRAPRHAATSREHLGKPWTGRARRLPDWRVTCFFSAKTHRRAGVASVALEGALTAIQEAGGGIIESYAEDVTDRKVSNGFLYNATLSLFEAHGFERMRRLGKHHWVVTKVVAGQGGQRRLAAVRPAQRRPLIDG